MTRVGNSGEGGQKHLKQRRRAAGANWAEREALEAELALLREENARMKVEAARPASTGRAIERIRGAAAAAEELGQTDDAWQALAEATMLREVLADMCEEVQGAVAAVQKRLRSLGPGHEAQPYPADAGVVAFPLRPAQAAGDGGAISSQEVFDA